MATSGTPYEGLDNIVGPGVYEKSGQTLYLGLYTNTLDSLSQSTVLANLTEPSGTGYARITLNGTWAYSNGVITYDHGTPDDPQFENSGISAWTGDVTGAFVTDGTYILHFKDRSTAFTMDPGAILTIDMSTITAS